MERESELHHGGQSGLRIRAYESGDELSINAQFNAIFNIRRPLAEWRWKFREVGRDSRIYVVVDASNEVRVQYAFLYYRLWYGGKEWKYIQPLDSFAERSSDVIYGRWFQRVISHCLDIVACEPDTLYILGFPSLSVNLLGRKRGSHLNGEPMMVWESPAGYAGSQNVAGRLSRGKPGSRQANALWEAVAQTGYIGVVRDYAWLSWRYSRPGQASEDWKFYKVRRSRFSSKLSAWGVFVRHQEGILWVDYLWDGEDELALEMVVGAAVRDFGSKGESSGRQAVRLWLKGAPALRAWLVKRGWREFAHPEGLYISLRPNQADVVAKNILDVVELNAADTDLF